MDTDRNLLFGVLALQADLIDNDGFAEACAAWATRKETPLADLLVQRGWLTPTDRIDVEKILERKLKKHRGDARAGLAEVAGDDIKQSLADVADPDVRRSLAGLTTPPAPGHVLLSTTGYVPESRDRYTLSRLHATGGIGRVWLARDASLGRDVALKELRPEQAGQPVVWARFLKEAQVTGQLEHPGIVPIYELGQRQDDQAPFYTMRFVRGRTLAEATAAYHQRWARGEAGPLELRELLTAFVGVCNAVAYAHSRGVLHRDLKPQNVVLGDYGEVMVLDWGLAKLMNRPDEETAPLELPGDGQADATQQGQVLGTPAYMAPEQADGRLDLLGPASDVYGLGAILYEIITGQPPFHGTDTPAVLRQVVHEAPARPRSLAKGTPPVLEAVCLRALAKAPNERYGTAKELAGDVQRWLADEPVSVYRDPVTVRLSRWARKHRTAVAIGAAFLQTAVVVLAVTVILIARSRAQVEHERAQVERQRRRAEAVNTFLVKDLLAQASPDANPAGERLTVRELLDKAAEAVATSPSMRENPEVEGSVRSAIGSTYFGLGLYQRAREELEQAVACQDRAQDVPAAERIFTKNRLCWVSYKLGSFDEKMPRQVLAQARAELGPDHEETVYAADTLATIALGNGKGKAGRGEPFDLLRDNLATQRRVLGPEHPLTVRAALNLADGLMSNQHGDIPQNLDEALAIMLSSRDAAQSTLGPNDPEGLYFEDTLGFLYARKGQPAEARAVLAPLQERFLKVFGPDHIDVALYYENLALAEDGLGHPDAAEALLLKSHALRKGKLGEGHGLTRRAAAYLGRVCMAQGKAEEAVSWLRVLLTAGVVRTGTGIALPANNPSGSDPVMQPPRGAANPGLKTPEPADISRLGDALLGRGEPGTSVQLLTELARTLDWLMWHSDWLRAEVWGLQGEASLRLGLPDNRDVDAFRVKDAVSLMEANPSTPPRILDEARARLKRVTEAEAKRPPR
jgi:tetratricopeptide (TPR) repeat protein/tRNA A-37 threonylcarbamoyl transferase component Bud32